MPPNFQSLYHYYSAAGCSISLKFGTKFDHVTADTVQSFKAKGSKVRVTVSQWSSLTKYTVVSDTVSTVTDTVTVLSQWLNAHQSPKYPYLRGHRGHHI